MRWLLVLVFLAGGAGALAATRDVARQPSVTALDVGQGDATLLDAGLGVLVDVGVPGSGAGALARAMGVPVSAIVITHLERDHAGDIANALRETRPGAVFWNGRTDAPLHETVRAAAAEAGVPLVPLLPGDVLRAGAATYRVLWPDRAARTSADHNDSSLVLHAELQSFSVLLTGDLAQEGERRLPAELLDADVLKVAHHGSKNSSDAAFLAAVSPEIALVSAGQGNRYGHPAPEALRRLAAAGARIFRTDEQGSVTVRLLEGRLETVAR